MYEAPDYAEPQTRYVEFRYDGERTLTGTAMKYGDITKLPWGDTKERFAPGAFGDVEGADVILNVQHDRRRPIARTGGGGLVLRDTLTELRVEARLPNTTDADDVLELVRTKVLRGLSVEFLPRLYDVENGVTVIKEAELRAIGVVDVPAYPKAKLLPREDDEMNETQIRALVSDAVQSATRTNTDGSIDVRALADAIGEIVKREMDAALKARDEATEARAEHDKMQKKMDELKAAKDDMERQIKELQAKMKGDKDEMQKKAEDRSNLLLMVAPLLPKDASVREKSNHEIMVMAVGDTVTDAANRSEDYLIAKLENLVAMREAQGVQQSEIRDAGSRHDQADAGLEMGRVNVLSLIRQRQERAATA